MGFLITTLLLEKITMVNNYINYLNIALSLTMGFSAKDFDKIYEYAGK